MENGRVSPPRAPAAAAATLVTVLQQFDVVLGEPRGDVLLSDARRATEREMNLPLGFGTTQASITPPSPS
jgi:hypothetical protein